MQEQIITAWKNLAKNKNITANNTLTYILLRAKDVDEAEKYIRKAFSEISNPIKLLNGRRSFDCIWTDTNWPGIKITKRFAEFGIEPTDEQISLFKEMHLECIKRIRWSAK